VELASVRDLKSVLFDTTLAPLASGGTRKLSLSASPMEIVEKPNPSIALGIIRSQKNDYKLAVRYQRKELASSKEMEAIRKKAKEEVDVRYIGPIKKLAAPWTQKRHRPLRIGTSIGHFKITAGTLGAFVKTRTGETIQCLSNNHVLANENRGKVGDAIIQPGAYDGGKKNEDTVAKLANMVKVKKTGPNFVDAATATLTDQKKFNRDTIQGLGKLKGIGSEFLDEGTEVAKLGRTTGLTKGKVTAFEVDNVFVEFDLGVLRFDNQFEIEGAEEGPFSQGGDSGSLIVDNELLAVGLLFAGGDEGGTNGQGLTYANPIRAVLDGLKVDLLFE
jgi:hypothetical protein